MNKQLARKAVLPAPLVLLLAIAGAIPAAAAPAQTGGGGGMMSMPPAAMVLQQMHMVNQLEIKAAALARQKTTKTPIKRYADRLWRDHHVADTKVKHLAKKLGFKLKSPAQMRHMMMQMQQSSMPAQQPRSMQMQQPGSMRMRPPGQMQQPSSMQMPQPGSMPTQPPSGANMQAQQPPPMMKQSGSTMGSMGAKPPMQKMRMMMHMMQQTMTKLQSASGAQFDQAYIMAMVKGHQKAIHTLEKVQSENKVKNPQVMNLVNKLLPILKQHLMLAQHLQNRRAS